MTRPRVVKKELAKKYTSENVAVRDRWKRGKANPPKKDVERGKEKHVAINVEILFSYYIGFIFQNKKTQTNRKSYL